MKIGHLFEVCINEGLTSEIDQNGDQRERAADGISPGAGSCNADSLCADVRTDGNAQAALGIAVAGVLGRNATRVDIAASIVEYVFLWAQARPRPLAAGENPKDGSLGLVPWFTANSMPQSEVYYGDNDGTVFISSVALAGLLPAGSARQRRLVAPLLHQALGNLRTTDRYGFRPASTKTSDMRANGWQSYFNSTRWKANSGNDCTIARQATLWSGYLWAGHYTGIELFGQRVYEATREQMAIFSPAKNRWQCITTMTQQVCLVCWMLLDAGCWMLLLPCLLPAACTALCAAQLLTYCLCASWRTKCTCWRSWCAPTAAWSRAAGSTRWPARSSPSSETSAAPSASTATPRSAPTALGGLARASCPPTPSTARARAG